MDRLEILDVELEKLISEKDKALDVMDTISKDLLDLELLIASVDEKIEKNKLEQSTLINYEKIENAEDMISQNNLEELIQDRKEKQTKLVNFFIENSSDEEKLENAQVFPKWSGDGVKYDSSEQPIYLRHNDLLYKVIQPHTSQPDWAPDVAVSLFSRIGEKNEETGLTELVFDGTNLYTEGTIGSYGTNVYESLYNNNGTPPVDDGGNNLGWWKDLGPIEDYRG